MDWELDNYWYTTALTHLGFDWDLSNGTKCWADRTDLRFDEEEHYFLTGLTDLRDYSLLRGLSGSIGRLAHDTKEAFLISDAITSTYSLNLSGEESGKNQLRTRETEQQESWRPNLFCSNSILKGVVETRAWNRYRC